MHAFLTGRYVVIGAYDGNASVKLYARCTLGRKEVEGKGSLDSTAAAVFIPPDGTGGKGKLWMLESCFFFLFLPSFLSVFLFLLFWRLAEGDEVSIVLSGSEVLMKS